MTFYPPLVRIWRGALMGVAVGFGATTAFAQTPAAGTQLINGQSFSSTPCATERWPLSNPVTGANVCRFEGARIVAFGAQGKFVTRSATGSVDCSSAVFGDPLPGAGKKCYLDVPVLGGGSTAVVAAPATVGTGLACFYEHINQGGRSLCVSAGSQSSMPGGWNDRVSSVQLDRGMTLEMFADANFGGQKVTLSASHTNFLNLSFNEKLSSYRLTAASSTPATNPVTPPSPTVSTSTSSTNTPATNASKPSDKAPAPTQNEAAVKAEAHKTAMLLWRNDLPVKHPKGSCAGCHGADFFDLARIGSTEADIVRRALTDGATADEAEALRVAILNMRKDMKLPATNARTFRPFQPGGQILLHDLQESQWNVAAVKRDIAFAENVSKLLPTFYGPRIATLAQAHKARDEMLDIARGSNQGGANPKQLQLRDLPVGIEYPLWSADKFHGNKEGTFNDWVSDLAFIPKPGRKVEWEALQNAYLARPANDTFWPMYAAVDTMLQLATPLKECKMPAVNNTPGQAICDHVPEGFQHKIKSAMIGQHLMRLDTLGRRSEFLQGALAFSYLDTQRIAGYKADSTFLPADLWDIGDTLARQTIGPHKNFDLAKTSEALGLPQFVVGSIDASKTAGAEERDIRVPWMWIGFTFDPSFARMSPSNATNSSEYLVASLLENKLFNHTAFMTHMRLMAPFLTEQSVEKSKTSATGVIRVPSTRMQNLIHYRYAVAYGRNVGKFGYDIWGEGLAHKPDYSPVPQALKDQSMALWSTQFGNGMRATLLLLLDELQNRPAGINKDWLASTAATIQKDGVSSWGMEFREHWAKFHPQHSAADNALADQVAQAIVKAAGL